MSEGGEMFLMSFALSKKEKKEFIYRGCIVCELLETIGPNIENAMYQQMQQTLQTAPK